MNGLTVWLDQATRSLAKGSAATVEAEIRDHYESAKEAFLATGASEDDADRLALADLGDPMTANCDYRKVLLTSTEARLLGRSNAEARAVCSNVWLRGALLLPSLFALSVAPSFFARGSMAMGWTLLFGSASAGFLFAAPFLPVFTPRRARVFRFVKWVLLLATLALALQSTWLLISCIWPLAWIEWTRVSIRRKLSVADWPKQLYL